MTWRERAWKYIAAATKDLPADMPLKDRMKVVDDACPAGWRTTSWGRKSWQKARREYLIPFGYKPRTKKKDPSPAGLLDIMDGK